MLELIDRGAVSDPHPVPLLFVHGAWHGAWCWDEHFLGFFAEKGYRALGVSLRGHGASSTPKPLRSCSFGDYLDDIRTAAAALPTAPVLIGHSMGGLLVQKHLEAWHAPAAVLLAPMSARAALGSGLRWIRRHPWHFTKLTVTGRSLAYVQTPRLARERFFSAQTPESKVALYASRLQEESARAGLDQLLTRSRPRGLRTPVLVLGAREDGAVRAGEVRAIARAYRTEAEFFPDMGHNMMLEPGWAAVAGRIGRWLADRSL